MRIETRSQEWAVVARYAEQRIERLQLVLERPNTDWENTIRIRAQIKELRDLLALPEALKNGTISLDDD